MTDPLSFEVIQTEFSDDSEAWVLQDTASKQYVVIPHFRYPGRRPIHFFMSQNDAEAVLQEVQAVNAALRSRKIVATKVKLLEACRSIAAEKRPDMADGFVVHPPNEVYEFLRQQQP